MRILLLKIQNHASAFTIEHETFYIISYAVLIRQTIRKRAQYNIYKETHVLMQINLFWFHSRIIEAMATKFQLLQDDLQFVCLCIFGIERM